MTTEQRLREALEEVAKNLHSFDPLRARVLEALAAPSQAQDTPSLPVPTAEQQSSAVHEPFGPNHPYFKASRMVAVFSCALLNECYHADQNEDLPANIDGSLLDNLNRAHADLIEQERIILGIDAPAESRKDTRNQALAAHPPAEAPKEQK